MAVKEALDLDLLWGDFFATGEYAPVSRILDVFDLPMTTAMAQLKQTAQFSLISHFKQHPKLVEIVKEHLDSRPEGSKAATSEFLRELAKFEGEQPK